jgi:carbonic anhydrase
MRLFEAILEANHRALEGDPHAGLHPAEFESELPIVALTCIDVRLNALLPAVLGVPPEHFIWLRNAGNVITSPLSSTMRSLALACAVKGGKEIAIIGHTDCQVGKTTTMQLLDRLQQLGVDRHALPDNLNEFFGMFGSERQNVIKACGIARQSPLIGPGTPVHGLVVDIQSGRLDWIVNGYETQPAAALGAPGALQDLIQHTQGGLDALKNFAEFKMGEMKFPESKIGEGTAAAEEWMRRKLQGLNPLPAAPPPANPPAASPPPPKIPLPPPLRPRLSRGRR